MSFGMKLTIGIILYVLGGCITYGYAYNQEYELQKRSWPNLNEATWSSGASFGALFPSYFWPVYWPGHLTVHYFQRNNNEK